jgi:hypothetical protein
MSRTGLHSHCQLYNQECSPERTEIPRGIRNSWEGIVSIRGTKRQGTAYLLSNGKVACILALLLEGLLEEGIAAGEPRVSEDEDGKMARWKDERRLTAQTAEEPPRLGFQCR